MNERHKIALDQALRWIESNFYTTGVFVSGSIIRGNPNANSDFDIYVIHTDTFRQRVQKFFNGVPCEIFVNPLEQVYAYFEKDRKANRPITAHLISTGKIVKGADEPQILKLAEDAKEYAITSAPAISEKELLFDKYALSNFFEDAADIISTDKANALYVLDKVVRETVDHLYLINRRPLPRIKERLSTLKTFEPALGQLIIDYYLETGIDKKYELARQLVLAVTGYTGFFEWSSEKE